MHLSFPVEKWFIDERKPFAYVTESSSIKAVPCFLCFVVEQLVEVGKKVLANAGVVPVEDNPEVR